MVITVQPTTYPQPRPAGLGNQCEIEQTVPFEAFTKKGEVFLLDQVDSDLASRSWWLAHGYVIGRERVDSNKIKNRQIHRIIMERMLGRPLERHELVDHINRNRKDNRRSNLRLATHRQNVVNHNRSLSNTSGYTGVGFRKERNLQKKYEAYITIFGKKKHLGYFLTAEEAALAYDKAAKENFGEFASLNFPQLTTEVDEVVEKPQSITPTSLPRPAGMGDQCQEYIRRPLVLKDGLLPEDGPLLIRCKAPASRRLVLQNGSDAYTVKFCDSHYEALQADIEAGKSLVEILGDEPCGR